MYESYSCLNLRCSVIDATENGKRFQLLTTLHAKRFRLLLVVLDRVVFGNLRHHHWLSLSHKQHVIASTRRMIRLFLEPLEYLGTFSKHKIIR